MNVHDLLAMGPWIVLGATAVVVLCSIAVRRSHGLTVGISIVGLALAALDMIPAARYLPREVTPFLVLDTYSFFYLGLMVFASLVVTLLAYGYFARRSVEREEFYVLLLLATLGSATLVASDHFMSFFLGLELLSVALYPLISYFRTNERGIEAGIKYLVLAGASSAMLLFGMALLYGELGTMRFSTIAAQLSRRSFNDPFVSVGLGLLLVGFGFKLAVAPFHIWTPDVYQGAPAPVSGFVATASKGAMLAFVLRFFGAIGFSDRPALIWTLAILAVVSMFAGNLLALLQTNVKRLLAYSSVAHMGYMLVPVIAGGALAAEAVAFYLLAYFVAILSAFTILGTLTGTDREAEDIEDYHGLFWRRPPIAFVFTASLLSLAGIPLTAGFIAKFYVLSAGVKAAWWVLVLTLAINSALGLYYYLRLVVVMLRPQENLEPQAATAEGMSWSPVVLLAAMAVLLVWLGVLPATFQQIIHTAIPSP